jgi:hypothetical protein
MRVSAVAPLGRRIMLLWPAGLIGALLLVGSAGAQEGATIAQAEVALEAARSARVVRAYAAPSMRRNERSSGRWPREMMGKRSTRSSTSPISPSAAPRWRECAQRNGRSHAR